MEVPSQVPASTNQYQPSSDEMSSNLSVRKIFFSRANEFWKRNDFLLWLAWCKLLWVVSGERWEVISISWQVETIERRGRGERRDLVMIFPIINTAGRPTTHSAFKLKTETKTLQTSSQSGLEKYFIKWNKFLGS